MAGQITDPEYVQRLIRAVRLRPPSDVPLELGGVVVPVIDIKEFLTQAATGAIGDRLRSFTLGFEVTNLATGQGQNQYAPILRDILLRGIIATVSMGITAAPAAAAAMQYLFHVFHTRQVPTIAAGAQSFINNAGPVDAVGPTVLLTNAVGLATNQTGVVDNQLAILNRKTFVLVSGEGGSVGDLYFLPLERVLRNGDFVGLHVDITGPAGAIPTEVQATFLYEG